ncbi:MAG: ABC transporter permease, partial [Gammaproteobacteria bacterium]
MTEFIALTASDLILASLLVLALIGLGARLRLGLSRTLSVAALRTTVQLLLVGLILEAVFTQAKLPWIMLIVLVMMIVAAWEIL